MIKRLEKITKMNQESHNKLLRLFARVDLTTQLDIMKIQKKLFYQLKSYIKDVEDSVLTLSSLILAIDKITTELDSINLNAVKIKAKKYCNNFKRAKIIEKWAIVRTLKLEQNMSFRDISKYLKKYNKIDVSFSTIYNMWNEIENNNKETNNV